MNGLESVSARIRPLRRVEYEKMVELGLFVDEKVELLRGESAFPDLALSVDDVLGG